MVDCVLIVVSYRSSRDIALLLGTVPAAAEGLSWHVVVVNNDPDDDVNGTVVAYPNVEVVEAGANLGYAGGINLGLAAAPASRFTVFLNPDLRLSPGSLARMATRADDSRAVVPAIRDEAGVVQPSLRREPTITASLGDALFGDRWPERPARLSEIIRERSTYRRAQTVDWATGAALLVPSTVAAQIGPWDSARFFLYSEETDYSRRLREAGVQIHFAPDAVVVHRGAGSGSSDALHALLEVNRARYFRKWHGPLPSSAFAAVVMLHNLLRSHRAASRAAVRALLSSRARDALPGGHR